MKLIKMTISSNVNFARVIIVGVVIHPMLIDVINNLKKIAIKVNKMHQTHSLPKGERLNFHSLEHFLNTSLLAGGIEGGSLLPNYRIRG